MKPTVITNSNSTTSAGSNNTNGITIPVNREYSGGPTQPQYHTQSQHYIGADPHNTAGYAASPASYSRLNSQQQHQPPQTTQQQIPAHFQQEFNFDPDIDMDMFPRSRLGRIHHDPFSGFGTGSSQFGFPQFNSLGRRRTTDHDDDDDFFRRMPQEFRQYIPENFAQRRSTGGVPPHQPQGPYYQTVPQSPSKVVCDAAIQTEDPSTCRDQVDHAIPAQYDNLSQHGLRNTMDMGVKSPPENANQMGVRSQSAPTPPPQQQVPLNGRRTSPPGPQQHTQYGTETSTPIQKSYYAPQQQHQHHYQQQQQPQQRPVYTKQQTPPPPQMAGGSYVRTIPIFVEGRKEPLINNREIPAQNNNNTPTPSNSATRAFTPPKQQNQQQQHRPPPLNTQHQQQQHQQQPQKPIPLPEPPTPVQQLQQNSQQQQQQQQSSNTAPPQTPHTLDSIQRIQDIQRDVLELMSHVEKFLGTKGDKDYAYLDEMLTRNLLKLDNIDTNGKESIRLARKEAIKCIQASINVLEAKAEENRKKLELQNSNDAIRQSGSTEKVMPANQSASGETSSDTTNETATASATAAPSKTTTNTSKKIIKAKKNSSNNEQPSANNIIQQPIPLPPPEGIQPVAEPIIDTPENNSEETATEDSKKTDIEQAKEKVGGSKDEPVAAVRLSQKEPSPQADTTKFVSDQTEPIAK